MTTSAWASRTRWPRSKAGAVHVQGTINGYGERTGNCNLTSVIPCVALKLKKTCVPAKSLAKLKELSGFVDEVANLRHNPRLPWVGAAAFAHKGGTHVNAVQKLASSYEHVDPSLVGNERNILISDLAGRSNIVIKAQELGFKITNDTPELSQILDSHQATEHDGYEYEAAEGFDGVAHPRHPEPQSGTRCSRWTNIMSPCGATRSNPSAKRPCACGSAKKSIDEVAEGDGPVNALDARCAPRWPNRFPN